VEVCPVTIKAVTPIQRHEILREDKAIIVVNKIQGRKLGHFDNLPSQS
jgi:hypothetical protein